MCAHFQLCFLRAGNEIENLVVCFVIVGVFRYRKIANLCHVVFKTYELQFFQKVPSENANVPAENDSAVMKTENLFCVDDV